MNIFDENTVISVKSARQYLKNRMTDLLQDDLIDDNSLSCDLIITANLLQDLSFVDEEKLITIHECSMDGSLYYIESDFDPLYDINFYTQNLVNGRIIERKAIDNLMRLYPNEVLANIKNYDEIGIVEFVASGDYYIKDNKIVAIHYDF